jgi:hypothetical protein
MTDFLVVVSNEVIVIFITLHILVGRWSRLVNHLRRRANLSRIRSAATADWFAPKSLSLSSVTGERSGSRSGEGTNGSRNGAVVEETT